MNRRRSAVFVVFTGVGLSLSLVLSGCAAGGSAVPTADPTIAATPTETATATATADPRVFTMPTMCTDILPMSRLSRFEADGLVLLGGPGGRYEGDYLLDPTPEESAGGITCIWGFADSEASSITVSVAPLSASSRGGIIDSFVAAGLNESELDGASIFSKQGDGEYAPAVVNSLRASSWISVITTVGGVAPYEEAGVIIAEVTDTVYTAP